MKDFLISLLLSLAGGLFVVDWFDLGLPEFINVVGFGCLLFGLFGCIGSWSEFCWELKTTFTFSRMSKSNSTKTAQSSSQAQTSTAPQVETVLEIEEAVPKRKCSHCGAEVPPGDVFCAECGYEIE